MGISNLFRIISLKTGIVNLNQTFLFFFFFVNRVFKDFKYLGLKVFWIFQCSFFGEKFLDIFDFIKSFSITGIAALHCTALHFTDLAFPPGVTCLATLHALSTARPADTSCNVLHWHCTALYCTVLFWSKKTTRFCSAPHCTYNFFSFLLCI